MQRKGVMPESILLLLALSTSVYAQTFAPCTATRSTPGKVVIEWQAEEGKRYLLQTTTNLEWPWEHIPGTTVGSGDTATRLMEISNSVRFFRVLELISEAPASVEGMIWIPPGTFTQGSPDTETPRFPPEGPLTEVTLTQGFFLGQREVTQEEYESVMEFNPSVFTGDPNRPVEWVTWYEAMNYCELLTIIERNAGRLPEGWAYRLPTEAEWEYACRADTSTPFAIGDGTNVNSTQANFRGESPYGEAPDGPSVGKTIAVGSYPPNAWGLYDMHGNVWEWCMDWFENTLPGGSVVDPSGPEWASKRAMRGGGYYSAGAECRSAVRAGKDAYDHADDVGFRVALAPSSPWL